jgi:predicted secreted acid phosphatase
MLVEVETIIQNTFIQVVGVSSTDCISLNRHNYSYMHPWCRWVANKKALGLMGLVEILYILSSQKRNIMFISAYRNSKNLKHPAINKICYHHHPNT